MYKWENEEKTGLIKEGTFIPADENNRHYREFLASGEEAGPWKNNEELKEYKAQEKVEKFAEKAKIDIAVIIPIEDQVLLLAQAMMLLRKESKGLASEGEVADLDALEVKYQDIETIVLQYKVDKEWLKDPARTLDEIKEKKVK